jgi:flagellar motor switch protein FliN/FliY
VRAVEFAPLTETSPQTSRQNIDLLMDVELRLTAELGQTRLTIREILELGAGSIVELNRLAGEPVDITVNNTLIAKGEVVVVDEKFGIRVLDVVSPSKRVASLM